MVGLNGCVSVFMRQGGGILGLAETKNLIVGFGAFFTSIFFTAIFFIGISLSTRISWLVMIEKCINVIRSRYLNQSSIIDICASNSPIITEEVGHEDHLMKDVIEWVNQRNSVSASAIQSFFRVGYSRTLRILNELEEKKMISQKSRSNGGRHVLIGAEAVNE